MDILHHLTTDPLIFFLLIIGGAFLFTLFGIFFITNGFGGRYFLLVYFVVVVSLSVTLWRTFFSVIPDTLDVTGIWLSLRASAIVIGIPMLAYLMLQLFNYFLKKRGTLLSLRWALDRTMFLLLCLSIFSFFIGLIRGNNIILIIGDSFVLLMIPLLYVLIVNTVRPEQLYSLLFFAAIAVLIFSGIVAFISFREVLLGENPLVFGTVRLLAPIAFFISAAFVYPKPRKYIILAIASVFLLIVGLKRGPWAGFAFLIALLPFILPLQRFFVRLCRILPWLLALVGIIVLFLVLTPVGQDFFESIERRFWHFFDYTLAGKHFDILEGRLIEAGGAIDSMGKEMAKPLDWLVGMGGGATYPSPFPVPRREGPFEDSGQIHTIHFTPATIFFRTGFIGILIALVFMAIVFLTIWRILRLKNFGREYRVILTAAFLYLFSSAVISIFTFSIFNDIFWGIFLGAVGVIMRR